MLCCALGKSCVAGLADDSMGSVLHKLTSVLQNKQQSKLGHNQSIDVTSVAMEFTENPCQPSPKSLVWLLSTFSTSPSKTTIQVAIDGNLGHPHYS
jgi:hypothetical protein